MAVDYSLPVRDAVMKALAVSALTGLVPAASQYRSTVPVDRTFPFTRYGAPIAVPLLASGLDSSTIRFTVHSFTKPPMEAGRIIRPAEDQSHVIAAAIVAALGDRVLLLGDRTASVSWLTTNQLPDPQEADVWHAVVSFSADVTG